MSRVRLYRFLPESRRQQFAALLARIQTPAPDISLNHEMCREEWQVFLRACHKTWHAVQVELLHEIVALEKRLRTLEKRSPLILEMRRWHWALRKLADSLAWTVIGPENLWIARRLCKHALGPAALTPVAGSNWESVERFVTSHNEANPDGFALISDITSFVHLGDALVRGPGVLRIVELKEGGVNDMLMERLDDGVSVDELRAELVAARKPKIASQLERMLRQHVRGTNTVNLLSTGRGVDQQGRETVISDERLFVEPYIDNLGVLFDKIQGSDWAIDHIDGCLFLGLYKGQMRHPSIFEIWLEGEGFEGPIVNYLDCMTNPLAWPPMLAPVVQHHVDKLLSGELVLHMGLDINALIALATAHGVEARWLSRKETNAAAQLGLAKDIFIWKNRALSLGKRNGFGDNLMGSGALARIFFEFSRPAAVLGLMMQPLERPEASVHGDGSSSNADAGVDGESL